MKRYFLLALFMSCGSWLRAAEPAYKPGEIIVKYKRTTEPTQAHPSALAKLNRKYAVTRQQAIFQRKTDGPVLLKVPGGTDIQAMIKEYKADPDVEYAEPNFIYKVNLQPNDPMYVQQGALPKIQAPQAWDSQTGNNDTIVAIVDTGVDYNHPDLAANMWTNTAEIPNNNIDDDHNGYVDDVRGWNFPSGTNDPKDDFGHGTHVAGIIGAVGNNNAGVSGVNWRCKLMAVKGLDSSGSGTLASLAQAVLYAADNGARVINNSWGGSAYSQTLADAIDECARRNIVVVCAAGNDSGDVLTYPAATASAIAVAATDLQDRRASFSNFGNWVDVSAPGVDILSTVPTYTVPMTSRTGLAYGTLSGTSMASPMIAGVAGILVANHPTETAVQIRKRIEWTADNIDSLNVGFGARLGTGRINLYKALSFNLNTPGYSIQGTVRNAIGVISGWELNLEGAMSRTTRSDAAGKYAFNDLIPTKTYSVTPTYSIGHLVDARENQYPSLTGNQVNQNYTIEKYWDVRGLESNLLDLSQPALVLAAGQPRAAYIVAKSLYHSELAGGMWNKTLVVGNIYDHGVSLGLDAASQSCLSYISLPNNVLKFARRVANAWQIETVDATGSVYAASMQLSGNTPYVAYVTLDRKLKVAHKSGATWVLEQVATSVGYEVSLALLPQTGRPGVAYLVNGVLHLASFNGTTWNDQTIASGSNYGLSLQFSSIGDPVISFVNSDESSVKVARKNGPSWDIQFVDLSTGNGTSLVLDSHDFPQVLYLGFQETALKYARWDGTTWIKNAVDERSMVSSKMVLDAANVAHALYVENNFFGYGDLNYATNIRPTVSDPSQLPVLHYAAPNYVFAGDAAFTARVYGTNFTSQSQVRWNGSNRPTTLVSPSLLTAAIPASDIMGGATALLTVFNAGARGGVSRAEPLLIYNNTPSAVSLSPLSMAASGASFTLNVNGSKFVPASTVLWNGSNRTTTFVSATQLTATISASDIVTPGNASVTVFNPQPAGGTSNALTFSITNPIPITSSLSPVSIPAGGAAFTLVANGSKLLSTSKVRWNGVDRVTTFVNATRLTAAIPATDIATPGNANVTVFTPTPGGGASNAVVFTITNPVPAISSLNPAALIAGGPAFTVTVNGSNFVRTSKIRWYGADQPTTFISANQLTASISAAAIASGYTTNISVFNPAPGGGTSNSINLVISNPVATVTAMTPTSATKGGAAFTLTVTGTNFVPTTRVLWNGSGRATTFVNATRLTAAVTAADIANAGTIYIYVNNPAPGGGAKGALVFTVKNPAATASASAPDIVITRPGENTIVFGTVDVEGDVSDQWDNGLLEMKVGERRVALERVGRHWSIPVDTSLHRNGDQAITATLLGPAGIARTATLHAKFMNAGGGASAVGNLNPNQAPSPASVYATPNPAKGNTRVAVTVEGDMVSGRLAIHDSAGDTVQEIPIGSDSLRSNGGKSTHVVSLDISSLSSGVYQLSAQGDGAAAVGQLLVIK